MTTFTKRTALAILLGILPLLTQVSSASTWTATASTCAVGSSQIGDASLYEIFNGSGIEFSDGNTGEIKARCNVSNPLDTSVPTWNTLTVGYQDPDGPGGTYNVAATLYSVNKTSGVFTTIRIFNSADWSNTGPTSHASKPFTTTFDFTNNAYWITLDLTRSDTNQNPGVWFVSLSKQ
jgi:hypothetical protein